MEKLIDQYIRENQLQPHPEGGYFHRLHTSSFLFSMDKTRKAASSVLYMLPQGAFSAFHRIDAEEVWYPADGTAMLLVLLFPDGSLEKIVLGKNSFAGQRRAFCVAPGTWMAARPQGTGAFSSVICHVTPAFVYEGFQLATPEGLLHRFPQHETVIRAFTRNDNTF
ncbi:MAG: cupin domain-containing protein [Bacteroidales bacterium]|nr:cupin domain-containing protein [Bacteroidales bacterium]